MLELKIDDKEFIDFYWKCVRCDYVTLGIGSAESVDISEKGLIGTPQGGTLSPILSNIYLHELDQFILSEILEPAKLSGKTSIPNPKYLCIHKRVSKLRQSFSPRWNKGLSQEQEADRLAEILDLEKRRRAVTSTLPGPGYRVYYVRYADDFLVGVNGTFVHAAKLRATIGKFLQEELNLQLNLEKTHLTNALKDRAQFLGAQIRVLTSRTGDTKVVRRKTSTGRKARQRVSGGIILMAPLESLVKRLADQGICKVVDFRNRKIRATRKTA